MINYVFKLFGREITTVKKVAIDPCDQWLARRKKKPVLSLDAQQWANLRQAFPRLYATLQIIADVRPDLIPFRYQDRDDEGPVQHFGLSLDGSNDVNATNAGCAPVFVTIDLASGELTSAPNERSAIDTVLTRAHQEGYIDILPPPLGLGGLPRHEGTIIAGATGLNRPAARPRLQAVPDRRSPRRT